MSAASRFSAGGPLQSTFEPKMNPAFQLRIRPRPMERFTEPHGRSATAARQLNARKRLPSFRRVAAEMT